MSFAYFPDHQMLAEAVSSTLMFLQGGLTAVWGVLDRLFLDPASMLSLTSLVCALAVAVGVLVRRRRRRRGRSPGLRLLARALFPRSLFKSKTGGTDAFYVAFNTLVLSAAFGWALVSGGWWSQLVRDALTETFGAPALAWPYWLMAGLATLIVFLAYELGYWIDHWSSHRFPALWEFHKTHHSAERLTPITVFRVHPGEMVKFANILALFMGLANGAATWAFDGVGGVMISGTNVILIVFVYMFLHLQHSQVWITFPGVLGRVFMSPAHHQIHHSINAEHYDRNFGACLCVWDRLFGTYYSPSAIPQRLRFGLVGEPPGSGGVTGLLIDPFTRFAQRLLARS
jgi:sterol desaturase/sphingolipid hydroxylase (fatty acid hydroxylase superfamily)